MSEVNKMNNWPSRRNALRQMEWTTSLALHELCQAMVGGEVERLRGTQPDSDALDARQLAVVLEQWSLTARRACGLPEGATATAPGDQELPRRLEQALRKAYATEGGTNA